MIDVGEKPSLAVSLLGNDWGLYEKEKEKNNKGEEETETEKTEKEKNNEGQDEKETEKTTEAFYWWK